MFKRRVVSLALALGLLLLTIGPAFALPVDGAASDQTPPGLAKKVFIHYDKDYARQVFGLGNAPAAATAEPSCTLPDAPSPLCPTYLFNNVHWNPGTIVKYYINLNYKTRTSPTLTKATATDAIKASFAAWESKMPPSGGITYAYQTTTKSAPGRADGRNVVGWGSLSSGTLAVTTVWYYPTSGQIVETDIAFNNRYKWAYTEPSCDVSKIGCNPDPAGPAGTYDVRNIGTHEAGHTLMLLDLYNSSNSALTMYGYGGVNELYKDSLGQGDINGIDAAY